MNISDKIIQLRKRKGYSTNKLAKLADIGQSTLREVEIGKKQPTIYTLEKVCTALGITLAEFFTPADEETNSLSPGVSRILDSVKKMNQDEIIVIQQLLDIINKK